MKFFAHKSSCSVIDSYQMIIRAIYSYKALIKEEEPEDYLKMIEIISIKKFTNHARWLYEYMESYCYFRYFI